MGEATLDRVAPGPHGSFLRFSFQIFTCGQHADVEFTTEPEFNRIVIAGEQGAGKSTMLNYLIGTKAGFSASGTATRRPISYEVKHEADVNPVRYELENEDGSWTQLRNEGELMEKLAEGQAEVKKTAEFSDKPMKVRLTGAGLHTIKLIDLPGFVTTSYKDMVIKINQSHLKRADALIVVVVAAQRDWDTVEQVATEQVQLADPGLKRTIIVATRLNQSLSELSSTYLDAKTGSGAEMFPGVPKFFVDAMVEHSEHGDYKPVLFPVDPKEAQNCIDDASAVLKEKLTSRFGAELMTRLDMYIGAKALYHYLVSTIVGTAATIRSWNNKTAMQLRNFVEKETKRLGRLVLPNDQASRLSVLRHAANLYANAWQRTVTADFDVSPSKVKCTTTSFDEHELFARSSLCSRDLRECWPLNNVRSEASLKLREPIGAPALAVLRFREDEMPAVLCEVMKTIAVGYSEDREKELNLYRGVAKATRHEEPRTVMVKAARAYLKGNEGLSDSLKYISARIVHLMCFLSMEFTIEQLKTTDSATTGSLDGSALYDSGLMRKGQPIYNWLENEAIFDYATSDRLAPDLKVKFIMAQICEFGTQVEELESSPSEKGISLPQVRAVANKLIKTSLSRFGSCADFLVDTFVTEIIERCVWCVVYYVQSRRSGRRTRTIRRQTRGAASYLTDCAGSSYSHPP